MSHITLPKRIVYVRHPECLHNIALDEALRLGIPNVASPLTKNGEIQCALTAAYLKERFGAFDATFASMYTRTHAIPKYLQVPYVASPLLNERNMGIWHLLHRKELEEQYPDEKQRLDAVGYYHYHAPEGESCTSVVTRIQQFLTHLATYKDAEQVLISGHGISGLCLRQVLFGHGVEAWYTYERLKNASVCVYEHNAGTLECSMYNHVPWEGKLATTTSIEA